jgi:hypothetical protein
MDDFVNLLRPFRGSDDFSAGGCLRLLYKDIDDDPLTNCCHVRRRVRFPLLPFMRISQSGPSKCFRYGSCTNPNSESILECMVAGRSYR